MTELEIRPLDPSTWDAFSSLVAKHNGIFGDRLPLLAGGVYERAGFTFVRPQGKGNTVMRLTVR
jgi:hypothetical protein